MASNALDSLDALCSTLPFHLNDVEQVNRVYACWHARGCTGREPTVDLWTYCFIRRYFLVKFMHEEGYPASDLDQVVDQAFHRVECYRWHLRDPRRYAHWVSVVCKNTFLNYVRAHRFRYVLPLDEGLLPAPEGEAMGDVGLVAQALHGAIARLPEYLQEVARLRFVEDCSYEEIARRTGRPAASTRTYISKVLARFRKDARLLACLDRPEDG